MSAGLFTTLTPAAVSAAIFSAAVPLPPAMIAPAWPIRRPGGAVWPAMNADDRLLEVRLDPGGGLFLGAAADLADHDHGVGVRIRREQLQRVDVRGADQRIAADADAGGLAHAEPRELVNRFVGQRAALRDDADAPFLADVPGMMPAFALPGRNQPGQFGPTSRVPGRVFRNVIARIMSSVGMPSVMQTTSAMPASAASMIASAANGGGTKITDAFAPVCFTASRDGVEDRPALVRRAALAGRDAADDGGAVGGACFA